ncbi:MAG: DNA-processing protein DprA, partial [Clostridia bacterium]|nr:DNA-processing protein DprA [Clostridia bacterium]
MTDIKYWIWFTLCSREKFRLARKLYAEAGNVETIYNYTESDYINMGITDIEFLSRLCDKSTNAALREIFFAEQYGVEFITIESEEYPEMLRHIQDPPLLLYKRGEHYPVSDKLCIGIVGTRHSKKGNDVAFNIARDLSLAGVTVVSGMAQGIDTIAHNGTFAGGGHSIAVLGSGVNRPYPAENKKLMVSIMNHGCILSEYPFDTAPAGYHFPERNRILSGLCHGVIVVEAPERSGALNSASHAADQGRDVFAFPGDETDSAFAGCRSLVADGAKKVGCVKDVLEEYKSAYPQFFKTKAFKQSNVAFEIPDSPTYESPFSDTILA